MTWTMINESNKFNEDKVLCSKQKNEIVQEFDNIKKEVINKPTNIYIVVHIEILFNFIC